MMNLYRGERSRYAVNCSPPGAVGVPYTVDVREFLRAYRQAKAEPGRVFPRGLTTSAPATGREILAEIRAILSRSLWRGQYATMGYWRPTHAERRGLRHVRIGSPRGAEAMGRGVWPLWGAYQHQLLATERGRA